MQNQTGVQGIRGENLGATLSTTLAKIYGNRICDLRLVELAQFPTPVSPRHPPRTPRILIYRSYFYRLLKLYLSPEFLLSFLANLCIPLWLGNIFKFMIPKLLENTFTSQKNGKHTFLLIQTSPLGSYHRSQFKGFLENLFLQQKGILCDIFSLFVPVN